MSDVVEMVEDVLDEKSLGDIQQRVELRRAQLDAAVDGHCRHERREAAVMLRNGRHVRRGHLKTEECPMSEALLNIFSFI